MNALNLFIFLWIILKSFPKNSLFSPKNDKIFAKKYKILLINFFPQKLKFFSQINKIVLFGVDFEKLGNNIVFFGNYIEGKLKVFVYFVNDIEFLGEKIVGEFLNYLGTILISSFLDYLHT